MFCWMCSVLCTILYNAAYKCGKQHDSKSCNILSRDKLGALENWITPQLDVLVIQFDSCELLDVTYYEK